MPKLPGLTAQEAEKILLDADFQHVRSKGGFMESIAEVVQNGNVQAVRLPKAFWFKGTEVKISKKGNRVILEPVDANKWPVGFWDAFPIDPDFKTPEALPSKKFSLD